MKKQIKRSPIEEWTLDRISPYEHNAKLHPNDHIEAIANSIEEFTFLDPVAVDENGFLLEGHGRLLAAKQRGDTTLPVIQVTGLSEAQKVAYRLAHNKLTMNTGFDPELLKIDFEFLKDDGFDLDLTGFAPVDLEFFGGGDDNGGGDDDIPEAEGIESRVQPGDIWKLGRHYICCGDCTVEENVRKLLSFVGGRSPDMVWSDPPYGIEIVKVKEGLGSTNGAKPFGSKEKRGSVGAAVACAVGLYAPIAGDGSINAAINSYELCNKLMPDAIMFFWGGNYYAHKLPPTPCWVVWDKRDGMTSNNFADAEVAWTNQSTPIRVFAHLWNGMIKASEQGERRVHPTQKPVKLAQWCFEQYGKPGDLIIDLFLGSGMSLIAAEQMEGDRVVCGFELSENYCETVCQRFEKIGGDANVSKLRPIKVGSINKETSPPVNAIPEGLGF